MTSETKPSIPITYDRQGRMNYHPDYHGKQGKAWTTGDENFLIENYATLGPEEVSFALERTIHTVATRASMLRKAGKMTKPAKRRNVKRLRNGAL